MMCAAAAAAGAGGGILSSSPSMGLGVRVLPGVLPGAGAEFSPAGPGMGSCSTSGSQPDCRSRYQLLLSGRALAEKYRRIYTSAVSDKEQGVNLGRYVLELHLLAVCRM